MAEQVDPHPDGRRQDTDVFPDGLVVSKEPAAPAPRRLDLGALVAGVVFIVLAVVLMSGVDLPLDRLDSGLGWIVLVAAGVALLVNELRRSRRRR